MKRERKRAARGIILPVAMAVVIVVLAGVGMASTGISTKKIDFKSLKGVTIKASSDPVISVNGTDELAAVPGILGNGTEGTPYIIQDKVINASATGNAGILIINTDAHLIIRNCTVTGSTSTGAGAISLQNVQNVNLTGNLVMLNFIGIRLVQVSWSTLRDNVAGNNSAYGIYMTSSTNNVLFNNTVTNNTGSGIFLSYTHFTTVEANNVSLHASSSTHGILLDHATNNTLTGNAVVSNRNGIHVSQYSHNNTLVLNNASFNTERGVRVTGASHDNTIVGNIARNNSMEGIYMYNCLRTTLENNTAAGNTLSGIGLELMTTAQVKGNVLAFNNQHGMYLANAQSITARANTIANNSGSGIDIAGGASNNVTGNIIANNTQHGILVRSSSNYNVVENNWAAGNTQSGIRIADSSAFVLDNNTAVANKNNGMILSNSHHGTVSGNNASWNMLHGVFLSLSTNNTLIDNLVSHNSQSPGGTGIMISFSNNNTVAGNNVSNNWKHGIYVNQCTGNIFSGNLVSSNGGSTGTFGGIYLYFATNTTVSENNVSSNWKHGIWLQTSSNHNNVTGNTVIGNAKGAGVYYGILVDGSSNNQVWDNEFSGNAGGRHALCSGGTGNTWDDGARGNYWEDYKTKYPAALASNGIWSIPYAIDTGYEDRFPLTYEPAQPLDLVASTGNGTITLTWSPPAVDGMSLVIRYSVYASQDGSSFSWLANTSASITELVHDGLGDNETWYYRVTASNDHGEGTTSTIASTTTWSAPGQVTGLVATAGNQQVTLSWTAPNNGGTPVTSYAVYWSTDNVIFTAISTTYLLTTYQHAGRDNGTAYFYKVAAVNALGQGANSSVATATTWTVPGRVTGVTVVPGDMQLVVSWTAPATGGTPITGYAVYWSLDNVTFGRLTVGLVTIHTITSLPNGQGYYFKVAAINAVGEGTNSTVVAGEPQATQDPLIITIVIVAAAGGGVALVFFLDKKGIVKLPKKGRA